MRINKTTVNGKELVHLRADDGASITVPWSEFWEICRIGAIIDTRSEVHEYLLQCDSIDGYDCTALTDADEEAIADDVIARMDNENGDQIYEAARCLCRNKTKGR